ncbi:MAG: Rieske 2Fe-2S domain-containing protein [Candidatus Thermoplasmatota archaeon]|jgi:Rieske Fe-S protein|nr:Rieske 2Fe-2S domain-containing protein [Candidatus Thermoplasmatota archaeon]MCL5794600.1 Rieske 2Fe-2S domain-containing protein [Candidatus Thermoplasmatota archaeon]
MTENKSNDPANDSSRRTFLKYMTMLGAAAVSVGVLRGALQNIAPAISGITGGFPTMQLVDSSGNPIKTTSLVVNNPQIVTFNYPLQSDPSFLLRLGDSSNNDKVINPVSVPASPGFPAFTSPGGTGPYKSVVASSAICQHLGCKPPAIRFHPPSASSYPGKIHCGCHGSTYDPYNGFSIITGPTVHPLPNITLNWDSTSDTYSVTGMLGPTIYGQPSDLSGGTPFPSGTTKTTVTSEVP